MGAPTTTPVPTQSKTDYLFDFGFGVIAPLICLIVDPVVFKGGRIFLSSGGLLAPFKIAAYTAIGLGVAALAVWLIFRPRLLAYSDYFVGIFVMAQVAAFLLAVVLLPFSVIGITLAGLGCLGFIPFGTAFVFYRQRKRARTDAAALPHRRRNAFIAMFAVIAIPILLQWMTSRYVGSAIHTILTNADSTPAAISQLKAAFWCSDECFYELALDYSNAYNDPARQQYLADLYHEITGGDIRTQISTFSD